MPGKIEKTQLNALRYKTVGQELENGNITFADDSDSAIGAILAWMKTPELSIRYSENIAAALAFEHLALEPSGEALGALTDHLGLKTPDTVTAALVYPGDRVIFSGTETAEDPGKADVASTGLQDLSICPEGVMAVHITELSERNILEGFAYSLMERGQFNQRMRILVWGAVASMTELGISTIGSTIQGPGLNWWLLGIPAASLTVGSVWLKCRSIPKRPLIVPSLDGLESPVRIVQQPESP